MSCHVTKSKCPTKRAPTVLVTPRKSNDTRNMPTVILKTVGLCATTRKLLTVAGMVVMVVFIFIFICIWQVELTP